ncbi:phosphatidylinositol phosphatase PTPRQ [Megalops cyprinoides]|uniref:phosphatidylinositol phosphatase PTPRQ n=1 Tax=Megalops cyprinoides TaxID=118141 RepID=UPI00186469E3|nr:phosphatidylinositol phosphatase PTPRQ [Megalops cyprinoides]
MGLQPAALHYFTVEFKTAVPHLNITITQRLNVLLETAHCPAGWVHLDRSCYRAWRKGRPWAEAGQACNAVASGAHLANMETEEDFLFISSYLRALNHMVLLWTGLNDLQQEGELRWSNGAAYNLTSVVTSSLPANQTDCFALQMNATGPNYFFTGFFCYMPLPYMCHYRMPPAPPRFDLQLEEVREREARFRWTPLEDWVQEGDVAELFLQYQEVTSADKPHRRTLSPNATHVAVQGLSPGRVYLFSVRVRHPSGVTRSLGSILRVMTRPNPPQNVTVRKVTATEVPMYWTTPDHSHNALFYQYLITWVDEEAGVTQTLAVENYTTSTVIGGLQPYHLYSVSVQTVTAQGLQSCVDAPLSVITAVSPPGRVFVLLEDVGEQNVTVRWEPPRGEEVDGYYIHARSAAEDDSPGEFWVNGALSFELSTLTPGGTYEIGVAAVKNGNRSEVKTFLQTLRPKGVEIAVPYNVSTHSIVLFVQRPTAGVFDGINVIYKGGSKHKALSKGDDKVIIENLMPGTVYEFSVYVTSRGMTSAVYRVPAVKTCLAPPTNVREGAVTDTSIEVLWDEAEGSFQNYEVVCVDCGSAVIVQKVKEGRARFAELQPGQLYNLSIRTEKENFKDSTPVSCRIRAAPSAAERLSFNKTSTSVTVSWSEAQGVFNGFILSITNATFKKQEILTASDHRIHQFEGLLPGSDYRIDVITTSGEKWSLPATIDVTTAPAAPRDVTFIDQDGSSLYVTWRHPQGQVEGYRLGYGLLETKSKRRKVTVRDSSVRIKDLTPGTEYEFTIQSFKGAESSETVLKHVLTRPASVRSLSLIHVNSSSAEITWESAVGPFDHYRLTVVNDSVVQEVNVSKDSLAYTASGLQDGCTYNVTVERVRNGVGGTAASLTVTTEPASPQGVRVTSVSSRSFSLRWNSPSGCVDRYQLDLSPNHGRVTLRSLRDGGLQADVFSVTPGTSYTATVTAAASGSFSSPVSRLITTNESTPGAPTNLEGERVGSTGILLSWTAPTDSNGKIHAYAIKYKEVCPWPESTFNQMLTSSEIPEYLLNTLTPGSTYNIKVAAQNNAGIGVFSKSLYIKTAEAPPGLVTNLTAFATNHSVVKVTWFLPRRTNGLITRFSIKAKHARTGQTVKTLEINAEDIMNGVLPHCNDAAEILSRGTPSPSETSLLTSASLPPITLSALPPASSWSVPISVVVDQLRSYTAYVFEVSAFTSDGEGQIASYMVRMPESAPEDPPQNLSVWNVTSKSFSLSWDPPTIVTGRFSYVIELYGPAGYIFENSTLDLKFMYSGLTPYTHYRVVVRAKSAGALGPEAETLVLTPAEAPSAVLALRATAIDSTSVRLSWRSPSQPNGLITQYKILVLIRDTVVRDITLVGRTEDLNGTHLNSDGMLLRRARDATFRLFNPYQRLGDFTPTAPPPASAVTFSSFLSATSLTNRASTLTEAATARHTASAISATQAPATTALSLTSTPADTALPWLTDTAHPLPFTDEAEDGPATAALTLSTDPPPTGTQDTARPPALSSSPAQPRLSTRAAVSADIAAGKSRNHHTAAVTSSSLEVIDVSADEIFYVVTNLSPFTEYTFSVSAFTAVGEGPLSEIREKTREQVPSSVQSVSYQNISSTSIRVSWEPPLNPNGKITHYTVYGLDLFSKQAFQRVTNETSVVLSGLRKYTSYKLRVAASTAVGESSLSEEDDIFAVTMEDEPDSPPVNLAVHNVTSSSATVTWSPPVTPNGIIQFYKVLYGNSTVRAAVNSPFPSVTLDGLEPYSLYNVSVRAYTKHGDGNQTSAVLQVLTGEDVPGSPPYDLTYESISSSEVNVSWRAPLLANGVIVSYTVEYWNSTHYLNVSTPVTSARLSNLRKYARYRVAVRASTRLGSGNHSSEVLNITTLEDVPSSPPRYLFARKLSDKQVELSWSPPLEANSEILYYQVRVWNLTSDHTENVTVTSVIVEVEGEGQYNASVSSWTRLVPADPPQNVSYISLTPTSVEVTWFPPTQPNGIIQFYTVYYSDNVTVYAQIVPVSGGDTEASDSPHSVVIGGLAKGSQYSMWITSSTSQGDGDVRSDVIYFYTMEDVPDGPIHNLTAQNFTSTAIIVSWDPPLAPNGKVFYHLSLQEAHKNELSSNKTTNKTTNDTVFLFTKLRKYTDYVLRVTPATSAGFSENSTTVLYLRTEDDVPSSPPLMGSSRNLSSSSIHVSWLPPLEPNGVITEYVVVLQGLGGANTTVTPNTSLTLTNLVAFTPYNVSIAAGNRRGLGPSLTLLLHTDEAGPASPPRNLSIFNHTADSVWLTWEASLEPNGVVQYYGFRILEVQRQTLRYQNSSSPSTQAQLTGFKPHSTYQITVCTFTKVGNGDQYSDPVTFTTNESVSEAVGNLSCLGRSWDSVFLEWEAPAHPNGELTHYVIRFGDGREEELSSYALQHTVTGLRADASYTFTVMAVNSAGPGEASSCNASTPPESVPGPPLYLNVTEVQPTSVTLAWAPPDSVPGHLREYRITVQLLSQHCEDWAHAGCVETQVQVYANGTGAVQEITLQSLRKYRQYRFRVAACTNAGYGEPSEWVSIQTLPGNPDAPPRSVTVMPFSSSVRIEWKEPEQLSGPTSYLIDIVEGPLFNQTLVRRPKEIRMVVVSNLTAFTLYQVTVTAFTGDVSEARQNGKASAPVYIRTLEEEPKDPPNNITLQVIPEEVTKVYVTFLPPAEPNGNISAYQVTIYREGQLDFQIPSLRVIKNKNQTMTAVIEGLKGGYNYSIRISAVNGAGPGPSSEVQLTTGIKAPPKPTRRPEAATDRNGVVMVTSRSITIQMPVCFFSDDHGPIQKVQVIVAEEAVMDDSNLTNWKNAFQYKPAPYLTDEGFLNPVCYQDMGRRVPYVDTYVIGAEDDCLSQGKDNTFCNGPLKPKTQYVFKFRATNIQGQYTDSDYSERTRTADDRLLDRDEEIILGVLLSFFLAVFLIVIIYASVRIRQKQKEGGTYSPREAEIIDTKFKLDQLIAVADLELKEEKLNRYSSFFFRRKEIFVIQLLSYRKSLKPVNKKSFLQHVEDLCANDNAKFQEEFAELPKLLHDLATSDADLPWNRSKNRFTNIKPYNNNRVKLLSEPGVPGSDYINASFVSGYLCPNEFIATQGPLPGTVADFWRMVWETRSRTIAMLTQCFEKGRIRCHQYWPEDNKPVTVFGDIVITKLTEDVFPDWTVRVLKVERHGDYMVVNHFNFTSWPEHGVPESSTTLIQFVKSIRANRGQDNTTMVVHCSAGVGRTGVFIALDHLIQHVRDHDFVDVYGLVAELRSERMCMVQNLAQYMFLHQSTLDLLSSKGNSQSIWFVNYSALEKMDSLDAMEGDVELEWEETTM